MDMDLRSYEVFELDPSVEGSQEREKDIYRKGHFPHSLLYNVKCEDIKDDKKFYGERYDEHFYSNSANYLSNLKKSYHQFKLVEITSPKKIETKLKFVFPKIHGIE